MEILFGLIAISTLLVAAVGVLFVWAVRSGQFDDLDSPAVAILSDRDELEQGAGAPESGSANGSNV